MTISAEVLVKQALSAKRVVLVQCCFFLQKASQFSIRLLLFILYARHCTPRALAAALWPIPASEDYLSVCVNVCVSSGFNKTRERETSLKQSLTHFTLEKQAIFISLLLTRSHTSERQKRRFVGNACVS